MLFVWFIQLRSQSKISYFLRVQKLNLKKDTNLLFYKRNAAYFFYIPLAYLLLKVDWTVTNLDEVFDRNEDKANPALLV